MANETLYDDELEMSSEDEYATPSLTDEGDDDSTTPMPADTAWPAHEDERPVEEPYHPDDATADTPPTVDPLDQLSMALTLRCGTLTMSLGELRRVAAGTVLEVSGITPGYATLCHGERVLAEGELVDVEGRLGLQITRMASPA
ncbi:FliM/FliN family flagellar motor switch protein [Pseudomonas abietaniphila]|uniref:FliM/FliN family flagellar motor switch protein n=1 Tax=Pseudomonas abietaniphila TaxID=89065 RepID=UPI000785A1FD|nr:FliM/FliN family flagellar motor switch protein [Pseudomonas abietaniphila]